MQMRSDNERALRVVQDDLKSCYPQFHIGPIGVGVQQGPKLPPL